MNKCKNCLTPLTESFSFGRMPIANNFLSHDSFKDEYFFEMKISLCDSCYLFQLIEQPNKNLMFHENYKFYSSLSNHMKLHFKDFSDEIKIRFLSDKNNPFVIEIGCNDGILIENFKKFEHLGIDPSGNVAEIAKKKGLNVIPDFFNFELSNKIKESKGSADIMLAANVICHIPVLDSIFLSAENILKDSGVFIFEEPYLGDVYKFNTFDQIYDEHVFLFSLHSINEIAKKYNLNLFDVKKTSTHGGSMRYYLCKNGFYKNTKNVDHFLNLEKDQGIDTILEFKKFVSNCLIFKSKFKEKIIELSKNNKICAYAATSKSTTLFNFCEIGNDFIEIIFDSTPEKQGLYSPGVHIPVSNSSNFLSSDYDISLLLAYNHATEIKNNEKLFKGKWLEYYPEIKLNGNSDF